MKSYLQLQRLLFIYRLMSFLSFIPMLSAMAMILDNGGNLTVGTVITLILSSLLMTVCLKRQSMYKNKMDNFDYKHYLDKKYLEIEDVPGLQDMIDREIFGDE